jgi:PTS system nitrogen regulatory IIA component
MTEPGRLGFVASILPELDASSMEEAVREMVSSLVMKRALTEHTGHCVLDAITEHEQLTTIELGCGIAIAYARYPGIDCALGAFARSEAGLEANSQPVNLVFLLVSPTSRPAEHLRALQEIATYLKAFDGTPSAEEKPEGHA